MCGVAAPLAVGILVWRRSRPRCGRRSQSGRRHTVDEQRCQPHEQVRICDGRDHEAVKAVENRPIDHRLRECLRLPVSALCRALRYRGTVSLVDDGGRVAVPDQDEVEDQPPGPAVAVEKRLNPFETAMERGERFGKDRSARVEGVHAVYPTRHLCGDEGPGDWGHEPGRGWMSCSRTLMGASRGVALGCGATLHAGPIAVRCILPDLGQRQYAARMHEPGRGDDLSLDPVRCIVGLYLQILAELLVADRPAFPE